MILHLVGIASSSFLMEPFVSCEVGSGSSDLSLIPQHPVIGHGSLTSLLKTELSPVDSMVIFHVYVCGVHAGRYVCLHVCEST